MDNKLMNLTEISNDSKILNFPNVQVEGLIALIREFNHGAENFANDKEVKIYCSLWTDFINRYFNEGYKFNLYEYVNTLLGNCCNAGLHRILERLNIQTQVIEKILEVGLIHKAHVNSFCKLILNCIANLKMISSYDEWEFHVETEVFVRLIDFSRNHIEDVSIISQLNETLDYLDTLKKECVLISNVGDKNNQMVQYKDNEIGALSKKIDKPKLSVSKLNKQGIEKALSILDQYEYNSQVRLVKKALKQYPSLVMDKCPLEAFIIVRDNPNMGQYTFHLLLKLL